MGKIGREKAGDEMRVQCCPGWVEVPRGSLLALLRKPLDVWSAQVQMCWPEME